MWNENRANTVSKKSLILQTDMAFLLSRNFPKFGKFRFPVKFWKILWRTYIGKYITENASFELGGQLRWMLASLTLKKLYKTRLLHAKMRVSLFRKFHKIEFSRKSWKIPTMLIYHQIYDRICELWISNLGVSWDNWSLWW